MIGAITGVAATIGVFNTLRNAVNRAFSRIDTMEQFERTMTTMLGSADEANKALEETNAIVKGTAYGLDTAAGAVQRFVTSSVNVEDATKYVEAFGDAVAFYGDGTNEQFSRVTRAMAQMATTGKTNIGDINALLDAGIPVFEIYGDAIGITAAEARKALEGGGTDASEFLDVMTNAFQEGTDRFASIEGAAKNAGASWTGTFDNMRAAVARGVTSVIQSIDEMLTSNGLPDMRQMVANFGTTVENVLNWIATNIPIAINYFKEVYNAIKPWLPLIASVVTAFLSFNTAINVINGVKNAVMGLRVGFALLKAAMIANPFAVVIGLLAGLAVMFVHLWNTSESFRQKVTEVFQAFLDFVMPIVQRVVDFVMQVWGMLVDWWNANSEQILSTAQNVWNTIVSVVSTVIQAVVSFVMEIWGTLVSFWNEHGQMILEAAMNVWTVIQTVITTVVTVIWTIIQTMASIVMSIMQFLWPFVEGLIISTWNAIKGAIQGAINVITGIIQFFSALFTGNWSALWDAVKKILSGAVQFIWNFIQISFVGKIFKAVQTFAKNFINVIKSKWDTVKNVFSTAINFVKNIVTSGFNAIKNVINTVLNFIRGIVNTVWSGISNTIRTIVSGIKNTISNIFNSLGGIVSGAFSKVTSAVRTGINNAYKAVTNKIKDFFNAGKNIVTSIADGIKNAVGKVTDAISGVTQKIRNFLPFSPAKEGALRDIMDIQIAQSIAQAIDKGKNVAVRSMANLTDALYGEMPQVDIAGQVRNIHSQSQRQMNYDFSNELKVNRQPAQITLVLGNREFEAFVEDINEVNAVSATLRRF
jgi:tape measure domain-containing protein